MSNCPFCGHEIDDWNDQTVRCSHCRKEITAGDSSSQTINLSEDQLPNSTGSSTLDYSAMGNPPKTDGRETDRDNLAETVYRKHDAPASDASISPPQKSPLSSTGQIREFVRSMAASNARPTATIRQNDKRHVHIGSLVLQRRSLASEQDPLADQSDYKLAGSVGAGGMGTVYSALQTSVGRDVAVKTLKPELAYDEKDRKKFLKEACITAKLDHPNIVPVHDLGIDDEGTLFYSMKLIRGDEWIQVMKQKTRAENLEILLRVCDAIGFAHSKGFMHRDIKAENVMLGSFGEVLVTDWGLAIELGSHSELSFGGSPAYMAPEMASHRVEKIGVGTDIYLLGATLFEIVNGAPPHPGRTATECMRAAANNRVRKFNEHDNLMDVVERAMSTEVSDRYSSVAEFQAAIRNYQSQMESLAFTENGSRILQTAIDTSDFEAFSRAVFSFQDAIRLWPENLKAVELEREARLEYAQCALKQKNFDLGLSVLEPETDEEMKLHRALKLGQKEQIKWRRYMRIAIGLAVMAAILAIVGTSTGMYLAVIEKGKAEEAAAENLRLAKSEEQARKDETAAKERAQRLAVSEAALKEQALALAKSEEQARKDETAAKERAQRLAVSEAALKEQALALAKSEEQARKDETAAKERAQRLAVSEAALKEQALALVKSEQKAKEFALKQKAKADARLAASLFGRYMANIKYAAAELNRAKTKNALLALDEIREQSLLPRKDLGWELHRLYQLCHENELDLLREAESPVQLFAASEDGKSQVAVLHDGSVWRRQVETLDELVEFRKVEQLKVDVSESRHVSSVAVSTDGRLMAVGYTSQGIPQEVKNGLELWNLQTGTVTRTDHREIGLGVQFVGFLDADRMVTISERKFDVGPSRRINVWAVDQREPLVPGKRVASAPPTQLDQWAWRPGMQRLAYALNKPRENAVDLKFFSFNGQSPSEMVVPVMLESDLASLAIVPVSPELDVSGTACICGLSDGSLVLPVRFADEAKVIKGAIDVNGDNVINADDTCQVFDPKYSRKLRKVIGGQIDISNDGIIDELDQGRWGKEHTIRAGRINTKDNVSDFELQNIELIRVVQLAANAHSSAVTGVRVFDGYVVSSSANGDLGIWRWNNSNLVKETTLLGHTDQIIGVIVDPADRWVVSVDVGGERPVRRWNLDEDLDRVQLGDQLSRSTASIPETSAVTTVRPAVGEPGQTSPLSIIGDAAGNVRILRGRGRSSVVPINVNPLNINPRSLDSMRSRFVVDEDRNRIFGATRSGHTIVWSSTDGRQLTSLEGSGLLYPMLEYDPNKPRFLTAGKSPNSVAVREKGAPERVVGEFQSLQYGGNEFGSMKIRNSQISNAGGRIAICAGFSENRPIISLLDVNTRKRLGYCEFKEKAVSSMMFESSSDELVVAFRLPNREGQNANPKAEICLLQPKETGPMSHTENQNIVTAPDSFQGSEIDLYFVGEANGKHVSVIRQFEAQSKRPTQSQAVAQIWNAPIWQEDATPESRPLGEVHPESRFELTGTTLTFVGSDGRPYQIDLSQIDSDRVEIAGIAESIQSDLKPGKKLADIVRVCKRLSNDRVLIAGMAHAWILEPAGQQRWHVVFRNLPMPKCRYVGLSNDGQSVLVHHADGRVHLFQRNQVESETDGVTLDGFYDLVKLSPDGRQIAVYRQSAGLELLDFAESYKNKKATIGENRLDSIQPASSLTTLAWGPQGAMIGAASRSGNIHLWDARDGRAWVRPTTGMRLEGHPIVRMAISPSHDQFDQRAVAVIDSQQQLSVFATRSVTGKTESESFERIWTKGPDQSSFSQVESAEFNPNFSENGWRLALGSPKSMAEIWLVDLNENGFSQDLKIAENQMFRVYEFPVSMRETSVINIGFDSSGRNLATLTADEMLLWKTDGWEKSKPTPVVDMGATETSPAFQ
jgi:WD40 repeat protein